MQINIVLSLYWVACGGETFMECDRTVRIVSVERKREKDLLWNALEDKSGDILKSKFPVVLRMPDQAAAFGTQALQSR